VAVIDIINNKCKNNKKGYFILIDPEKKLVDLKRIVDNVNSSPVDAILVGGSNKNIIGFQSFIAHLKKMTNVPVIIFPGSHSQVSSKADAIFLLSLINSRSVKYLIGEHIDAAEKIVKSKIEVIQTSYIVMDKTGETSVSREVEITMLKTKKEIEKYIYVSSLMHFDVIYLDAGSGAFQTIDPLVVKNARKILSKPIILGGGINTVEKAKKLLKAGADFIVTGNAIERNPDIISDFGKLVKRF